jgi:PAS domain S-box-containing protein
MIKIYDLDGKYLYVNRVVCKTLGYTNEELMQMNHDDIEDTSYLNNFKNKDKNFSESKEQSFEGVYIAKNREKIPVDINTTLIKYHGKVARLTVARNISGRKKAEKEREDLLKKLALKNEELESIIYAASHDLKTPIINIFGFGKELLLSSQNIKDLLRKSNDINNFKKELNKILNDDITQSVNFITKSSLKMEQLLNGLLKVSRLGRVQLDITSINMNVLLRNIIDSLKFKINETKTFLTCSKLPKCIGDVSQINRVFTNLIDNSLKYLDPKKKTMIKISGKKKGKMSIYCVEDNGIGVPKDKKNKMFEIFYRFDSDINPEGEGIGLTIVKKIVEQHNGDIWVESEEGIGSKFYVTLPNKY